MPRNGSGVYSKAAGTTAVSGTTIESLKYNEAMDDIVQDLNTKRPITAGGTGATNIATARTNLSVYSKSEIDATFAALPAPITPEIIDDRVDALLVAGTGIIKTYDDAANTLTLTANVGTTANKLIQLDADAKIPALDGSLLTNIYSPINYSVLTTSQTYTFPTNITKAIVQVIGGGGGGAGVQGTGTGTVTVGGTGGTTSFTRSGFTLSATGGAGMQNVKNGSGAVAGAAGVGSSPQLVSGYSLNWADIIKGSSGGGTGTINDTGAIYSEKGGDGGVATAMIDVSVNKVFTATIGAGGTGTGSTSTAGQAGLIIIMY